MSQIVARELAAAGGYRIGCLSLDAPRVLNALTLDMALEARQQLACWATDSSIVCVVLTGQGRAFCAGGDVRRLRESVMANDDYGAQFFEHEYRLDYALHCFPKPIVAWGHGVVMGGGLGLLSGCSHRIVTGSSMLAMPEIRIGLYPDVGASHYLHQLPGHLGLYLGLTGASLQGAPAVAVGLADYVCHDEQCDMFIQQLTQLAWAADRTANDALLHNACKAIALDASRHESVIELLAQLPELDMLCSGATLPDIVQSILADTSVDPWRMRNRRTLAEGCPVTAWLVYEQRRRSAGLPLADIFRQEWMLSMRCLQHADFAEGVRAQLVDKDGQPRWMYRTVNDVPVEWLSHHFYSAPVAGVSDIQNPLRDL